MHISRTVTPYWLTRTFLAAMAVAAVAASAQPFENSLSGKWHFGLDPLQHGEDLGWHAPPENWTGEKAVPRQGFDMVEVPHCWNVDPRYQYVGRAWYRKSIEVPAANDTESMAYRLEFGAVYHRCRVWLNGQFAGTHEGGFTPFGFDVTQHIKPGRFNFLVLEVDNSWTRQTLPGARKGNTPAAQVFPWWPNGGITRDVRLVAHANVYVESQVIDVAIDFNARRVDLDVIAKLRNQSGNRFESELAWTLADTDSPNQALATLKQSVQVPANSTVEQTLTTSLPLADVQLWGLDTPELYFSQLTLNGSNPVQRHTERFGMRAIEIDGPSLKLNGEPIRLAGANRAFDHPKFGTIDPPEVVAEDGRLLKEAGLELHRLQHQPLSKAMLDWADENGLLIIQEAGSWGMGPKDLLDPVIQRKYRVQLAEMVNMSRNHPSVIGWSVGNEYQSWTPEGVAWTKQMKAFIRNELQDERPVVFVALGRAGRLLKEAYDAGTLDPNTFSFAYSDILCINWYGSGKPLGPILDVLHETFPQRPIMISENGLRVDQASAQQRVERLREALTIARQRPFVISYSYWSFNDYRSMYPGTNPSGVRPWGLVTFDRTPRPLYHVMAQECAPLTLTLVEQTSDAITVTAKVRSDFPSMTVHGYTVALRDTEGRPLSSKTLPSLGPDGEATITLKLEVGSQPSEIVVVRPGGWRGARIALNAE